MKQKLFFLLMMLTMASSNSNATVRRVGYFGIPINGVDYLNFSAAYTAAASGDTLMVFPGITINQTFTKKLIIIGPGNWLDPNTTPKGNANMQAFAGEAFGGNMTFNAGSDGSVIMGLSGGTFYVGASNITIRRNREISVQLAFTSPVATTTNIQIIENYRVIITWYFANGSTVSNLNVSNNFITFFTTALGNTYNGNISNNIWAYEGTLSAGNANGGNTTITQNTAIDFGGGTYLVQNNIFCSYSSAALASNFNYFSFNNSINCTFNYNIALQTTTGGSQVWPAGSGNIITPFANASTIFSAFPAIGSSSADARYQLTAGSPALMVNRPGSSADAGIFGGVSPYKLSTIPPIPSIYMLSSPQGNNPPGSSIQINLSTRGNN